MGKYSSLCYYPLLRPTQFTSFSAWLNGALQGYLGDILHIHPGVLVCLEHVGVVRGLLYNLHPILSDATAPTSSGGGVLLVRSLHLRIHVDVHT